jgi:hypothetical protein
MQQVSSRIIADLRDERDQLNEAILVRMPFHVLSVQWLGWPQHVVNQLRVRDMKMADFAQMPARRKSPVYQVCQAEPRPQGSVISRVMWRSLAVAAQHNSARAPLLSRTPFATGNLYCVTI